MTAILRGLPMGPTATLSWRRSAHVIERNVMNYRRNWFYLVSGFFEPLFYLLAVGAGVGQLVGTIHTSGHSVSYAAFVAPGLLASAAMNGAIFDATYNFFFKLKVERTYEAMLATPLSVMDVAIGELGWTLVRGTLYAGGFLAIMAVFGDCHSDDAILCLPAAMLITLAFAALGLALTSYMSQWQHLGTVALAVLPLFLFSGTFYGLDAYPGWLQEVVRFSPLYQGVALLRALALGHLSALLLIHVLYLVVLTLSGLFVVSRRLARVLTP